VIGEGDDTSIFFAARDTAIAVFARDQAAFAIERQAVGSDQPALGEIAREDWFAEQGEMA
jgi:hypothetical protein